MKLFNYSDFYYVIEHNNEYFEFEIEDEFLDSIVEDLDMDNFKILSMNEINEGKFEIIVEVSATENKTYPYELSEERKSYIQSAAE